MNNCNSKKHVLYSIEFHQSNMFWTNIEHVEHIRIHVSHEMACWQPFSKCCSPITTLKPKNWFDGPPKFNLIDLINYLQGCFSQMNPIPISSFLFPVQFLEHLASLACPLIILTHSSFPAASFGSFSAYGIFHGISDPYCVVVTPPFSR